jgi:hypothetical protein
LFIRRQPTVSHGRDGLGIEALLGDGRGIHRRLCRKGKAMEDTVERLVAVGRRRQRGASAPVAESEAPMKVDFI